MDKWETLFSSVDHGWRTPPELFEQINQVCCFDLDGAASPENALCPYYMSKEDSALSPGRVWPGERVWVNPPYGKATGRFVAAAREQARKHSKLVVLLVPARTDTRWWQDCAMDASAIFLIRGRIRFLRGDGSDGGGASPQQVLFGEALAEALEEGANAAPFPSALLVFNRWPPLVTSFYRLDRDNPGTWQKQLASHIPDGTWSRARAGNEG